MLAVLSAGIRDALPLGLAIQVRRYVYCDVVRTIDINEFVDIDGIQVRFLTSGSASRVKGHSLHMHA